MFGFIYFSKRSCCYNATSKTGWHFLYIYPMRYIIILLILILTACSAQKKLNRKVARAERFADRHGLTITDTIHIVDIDTFIVESYTHDTIQTIISHDTHTVVNNERVKLMYRYDTITNEIWHHVECKSDTIIQTETIPVITEKIKTVQKPNYWYHWLILAVVCIAAMRLMDYVLSRKN